jgi:hypothetical protein
MAREHDARFDVGMQLRPYGLRLLLPAVAAGLLGLAMPACTSDAGDETATPVALATTPEAARAAAARDALRDQLQAALVEAIQAGGPANGIEVCRTKAREIAAEVGEELGVAIGRTSHRLRNPANDVPSWASEVVSAHAEAGGEAAEATFVALGEGGGLGALYPIRLEGRCVLCHGTEEQIPDVVRGALADHYPEDRATGFAVGDLRGWFWVEVPGSGGGRSSRQDAPPSGGGH